MRAFRCVDRSHMQSLLLSRAAPRRAAQRCPPRVVVEITFEPEDRTAIEILTERPPCFVCSLVIGLTSPSTGGVDLVHRVVVE